MKFLPKEIKWISPYDVSGKNYMPVLVATHKHSARDWQIYFGYIQPINGYTSYKIMIGTTNSSSDKDVPLGEILAIGVFKDYGEVE